MQCMTTNFITPTDGYAATYPQARQRWLAAVSRHSARIDSRLHPNAHGPDGGQLYMDVACIGDPAAQHAFVITCGTHGIEGYAGSAVLTAWLESDAILLPSDCKLVLIHAVNPWGFAHGQRVTEENVDLNRNFINFATPLPSDRGYSDLHPALMLERWDEPSFAHAFEAMDSFRQRHGEKAFSDAFNGGQYTHPDGLFFGGHREQWSNTNLREVLEQHVKPATRIDLLDIHTGIGPYGQPFFINFDPTESRQRIRLTQLWGEEAMRGTGSTHAAFATYQGVMLDAVTATLPGSFIAGVVVEFGTHPRPRMQRALLTQAWLSRQLGNSNSDTIAARAELAEAYAPSDPQWRSSVLHHGVNLCRRGLSGLLAT